MSKNRYFNQAGPFLIRYQRGLPMVDNKMQTEELGSFYESKVTEQSELRVIFQMPRDEKGNPGMPGYAIVGDLDAIVSLRDELNALIKERRRMS